MDWFKFFEVLSWAQVLYVVVAAAALAVALWLFSRRRASVRAVPGSEAGPHPIAPARGRSPGIVRPAYIRSESSATSSDRADQIVHDLRMRATEQLIEYIGGAYAPDVLKALLEHYNDPSDAVARLVELLGEDPAAVVAAPGHSREAFLDRLDAFVQLEAEIRTISPDANKLLFELLRDGRAVDVRNWAAALHSISEASAMLQEVKTLAPGPIGIFDSMEAKGNSLFEAARTFMPINALEIASAADELKLSAQALLRFATDWHQLDRRREVVQNRISARWDMDDPTCQSIWPRLEASLAGLEESWKAIANKRIGIAELRGTLDDMEIHISALEGLTDELERDRSRTHAGGGSRGGPHRRRSRGYGPDGRDTGARAHADPYHHVWEFFGFDARPTRAECKLARNRLLRENHPDVVGDVGTAKTQEINRMWSVAHDQLRDVHV